LRADPRADPTPRHRENASRNPSIGDHYGLLFVASCVLRLVWIGIGAGFRQKVLASSVSGENNTVSEKSNELQFNSIDFLACPPVCKQLSRIAVHIKRRSRLNWVAATPRLCGFRLPNQPKRYE